jgi:tRNA(Ile)-lysidine synthase
MIYLDASTTTILKSSKNLLAFSAGVDSSALFFLLIQNNIEFDIALINYQTRDESDKEELHAIELAKKYNLKIYTTKAPSFQNNFEKNGRDFRYNFFDKIIKKNAYDNLLTAHQLNDQLEWLLMRLTKGAGTLELLGLDTISQRKEYRLIRPLLHHTKEELLEYLDKNAYPYFIDKSNIDERYERNRFRKNFSNKLLTKYKDGIKRSFDYLREDKKILEGEYREIFHYKKLYIISYKNHYSLTRIIDRYLKKLGYLLSASQREELKLEKSIVFGGVWAVEIEAERLYIAPYRRVPMPKVFKEKCRIAKLPKKIRAYLYEEGILPTALV